MYRHPVTETRLLAEWAEKHWRRKDDQSARDAELVLDDLRALAWSRVPEWSPELREQFHREHPRYVHH
jgi:hypothetical protein